MRSADHGGGESGGHDESGPGFDHLVDLLGEQDRSGTDMEFGEIGEDPDRLESGAGSESDLGDGDAAGKKGPTQGKGLSRVVEAGARFVVSPGFSAAVVRRSHELDVPALPGVATSSELMAAMELGLNEVKFFPAGLLGGPAAIKALTAPFTAMSFMPSGGVNAANMGDYLALPAVPAVSGSWMVDPQLIRSQRWDEISRLSAEAIASTQ